MSYQVLFSFHIFPNINFCYLPCILLIFFSFLTEGNSHAQGEKEKLECDGFLTKENILAPRNSVGDLIGKSDHDPESSSDSDDDSKQILEDSKGKIQPLSEEFF